jgi:hypothetical protein
LRGLKETVAGKLEAEDWAVKPPPAESPEHVLPAVAEKSVLVDAKTKVGAALEQ